MEKAQKSFDFQKSQLPEQSYLEAVFPDMKPDDEESDEMSAKIPMATLGMCQFCVNGIFFREFYANGIFFQYFMPIFR